jgi:monoamine oxidase
MADFDVVVVGAGAAGLAAAWRLAATQLSVLVVEARDRIGGRAHTVDAGGYGFDRGCGWLHSADRNPFVGVAEALGFEIDRAPPPWNKPSANHDLDPAKVAAFRAEFDAFAQRLEAAAATGADRPASDLLTPGSPFNARLNAFSAAYNGAELDQVSVLDYEAYEDSGLNWRVAAGYGAMIAAFGAAAPVRLSTPVTAIDHGGGWLRIETPGGVVTARAVIVTLPTDLIASGAIAFRPGLPDKLAAAAGLPLGLADKLMIAVEGAEAFEADSRLYGHFDRVRTGNYHVRPFGRPLVEGYFGGRTARELEAEGPGAFGAFAVEELCEVLGSSWRRRLTPLAETAWASDPWARGSYSHALPGHAGDRAILAAPVDGRLFFAGEATSPHAFSTAHGACESGVRAAQEAIAALA